MKPLLVIGLGNPLMGDDGVGCAVVECLAADRRLPDCVEVMIGGSDLLRCAGQMEGRSRVVVIDALQDGGEPGGVLLFEEGAGLDDRQGHAHHLSAAQAIRLAQMITRVPCTLLGISIPSVTAGPRLSPALGARLPAILDRVLQELTWISSK
jgi:hydrogenase maturation protease